MPGIRGRNWTPNSTEMAEARGQNRVEQNGSPAVLPRAGAVPPPRQGARHGTTCPPTHLELMRRWVRSQPPGCRWAFADHPQWTLARDGRTEGTRSRFGLPSVVAKALVLIRPASSVRHITIRVRLRRGPDARSGRCNLQVRASAGCMIRSESGAPGIRCRCGERASLSRRRLGRCGYGVRTSAGAASDRPAPG
jgi:hypothetical protein